MDFVVNRAAYEFSTQELVMFQLAQTFGVNFITVVRKTQAPKIPKHLSGHDYTRRYRTPLIRINCACEQSGYAENPDNWTFLCK